MTAGIIRPLPPTSLWASALAEPSLPARNVPRLLGPCPFDNPGVYTAKPISETVELCPAEGKGRAARPPPAPRGWSRQLQSCAEASGVQGGAGSAARRPGRQDPRPPACSSAPRGPRSVAGSRDRTFLEGELLLPGTQTLTPAHPPPRAPRPAPLAPGKAVGPVIPGHLPFPTLASEFPWVFWANRREASLCACGGGRGAWRPPAGSEPVAYSTLVESPPKGR